MSLAVIQGLAPAEWLEATDVAIRLIEMGRQLIAQGTALLAGTSCLLAKPETTARGRREVASRAGDREVKEAQVDKATSGRTEEAPSSNTQRQYERHWERYDRWLDGRPPTDRRLARYLAHLYESGSSAGTVALALAAMRWAARQGKGPLPGDPARACLAGIRGERVARKAIAAIVGCEAAGPDTAARLTDRQLDALVARLSERALSPRTTKLYAAGWRDFLEWRGDRETSETTLCQYVAYLHETGKSVATAKLAVAAVRHHARELGIEIRKEGVGKCLVGFRRKSPERGLGQVNGLKWEQADRMCERAVADGTVRGLRDAALIAVMSDALLRVSDANRLEVGDIAVMEDGSGRALLPDTKTDREGKGVVQYLGPSTVDRIRAWREASDVEEGRLFRQMRRGGHATPGELGVRSIRKIIVDRAREIGVRERVSGHSLRVGAAQSLAERNTSLVGMQRAGNWASPSMPAYYTREQEAGFGFVARLRYGVRVSTTLPSGE